MNKVICDICGTSYPEDAEQCPICGYSHDFQVEPLADGEEFVLDETLLEDIKVKDEVVKEPVLAQPAQDSLDTDDDSEDDDVEDEDEADEEDDEGGKRRPSAFLIAMLVIVIVALLALTGYIFMRYYLPGMRGEATEATAAATTEESVETTVPTVPCTNLAMTSDSEVLLEQAGNKWLINVVVMPENTTDEVIFLSNNLDVATVDADGTVTAVSEGSAVISVICGDFSVECNITCAFVEESSVPDETGTEPATEAETEVPDDRETKAPSEAETEAPNEAATEAPTEAATEAPTEADSNVLLQLSKADISFDRVGVYYTLKVANGINPEDVEWSTGHSGVCVVKDGVITTTGPGMTKVTAKYKGQEATCIVRVTTGGTTSSGNQG